MGYLTWQRNNPRRLEFENERREDVEQNAEGVLPEELVIERVGIRLPVVVGKITNEGVTYASDSAAVGERGNSIFYGHNWKSLLGELKRVVPGDEIEIVMADGSRKKFKVEYVQEVSPKEASVLEKTEDKRMTLYTCSGFLDRRRLVVTAFLRGVDNEEDLL
jgi:LPXTG-site transpeptidase (sortase) family protein